MIFINDVENGIGLFPFPNLSGTIIFADGTRLGSATSSALVDRNGNRLSYTPNGYQLRGEHHDSVQYQSAILTILSVTLVFLIAILVIRARPGITNSDRRHEPALLHHYQPYVASNQRRLGLGGGYNWGTNQFAKSYGLYAQRIDDRDVLTEVVLPEGRSLRFKYNEFGEVAEIELPTGAKIRYDYGYTASLPSGNSPAWETGANGVGSGIATDVKFVDRTVQSKRTYPDRVNLKGTWTFSYGAKSIDGVNYPCTTVTVNSNTSVLLSKQRHLFLQGGRYTEAYNSQSQHDGTHYTLWSTGVEWSTEALDAAGNVLAASEQDWTQRTPVSWSSYTQEQPANDNRVNQTCRCLEIGMMAKVETYYDQYNNPVEVKEYDYDQTLKRRTVTAYLTLHNNGFNYQTDDSNSCEINVFGLEQNYTNPVEPTLALKSTYALTNFEVQTRPVARGLECRRKCYRQRQGYGANLASHRLRPARFGFT